MFEMGARIRQAIEELTGNEALLQMLDSEPANELLQWGIRMATSIVKRADPSDGSDADAALQPRLKAVRKTLRTVGNWAAGQYTDSASRVELKDSLLENFRLIFGEDARLPSGENVTATLDQVDEKDKSPQELILGLKRLFEESG